MNNQSKHLKNFFYFLTAVFALTLISCGAKAPKPLSDADKDKLSKSMAFEDTDMAKDQIGGDVNFDPGDVKVDSYASTLVFMMAENDSDITCASGTKVAEVPAKGFKAGKVGTIPEGTAFVEGAVIMLCLKNEKFTEKGPNGEELNTLYSKVKSEQIVDNFEEPPVEEEETAAEEEQASTESEGEVEDTPVVEVEEVVEVVLPAFEPVYFAFDKYDVDSSYRAEIESKVAEIQDLDAVRIIVEGHADERGSNEYNLALGERRATAIKRVLSNLGVALENITTISYGEENPIDYGHDENAWAQNRRGIIVIRAAK